MIGSVSVAAQVKGDLDDDGFLNMMDAFLLYSHCSGRTSLSDNIQVYADINEDSSLDMQDAMMLYTIVSTGNHTLTTTTTSTIPTTSAPTAPPHVPITAAQAEAYANSYMASLGINIDYSYNLSNSGYYPPTVLSSSDAYDEATKAYIRQRVDRDLARCGALIPGDYLRAYATSTGNGGVYLYILR